MQIKHTIGAAALFAFSATAQATLVTEYWTSTVTGTTNITGISVGETFNWSVTLDNEGRRMTQHDDGGDGTANTSDDTLFFDWCVSGSADGCTINSADYSVLYSFFSDATFVFAGLTGVTGANFVSSDDFYSTNYARSFDELDGDQLRDFQADDFRFSYYAYDPTGQAVFHGLTNSGSEVSAAVDFTSTLNRVVLAGQVPVPAPLALMGLGFAAIGSIRGKRFG